MKNEILTKTIDELAKKRKNYNSWLKYYKKNYDDAFYIDDKVFMIEKPRIETSFCYGYGQNGISTTEEYKNARDNEIYTKTSFKNFINENLENINRIINNLKKAINNKNNGFCENVFKPYLFKKGENLLRLEFVNENLQHGGVYREATKEDLQTILNHIEEVKKRFIKRLEIYLKRYGLSKVHTWSYLVD